MNSHFLFYSRSFFSTRGRTRLRINLHSLILLTQLVLISLVYRTDLSWPNLSRVKKWVMNSFQRIVLPFLEFLTRVEPDLLRINKFKHEIVLFSKKVHRFSNWFWLTLIGFINSLFSFPAFTRNTITSAFWPIAEAPSISLRLNSLSGSPSSFSLIPFDKSFFGFRKLNNFIV